MNRAPVDRQTIIVITGVIRRIFATEDDAEACAEVWRSMGLDVVVYSATKSAANPATVSQHGFFSSR